MASELDELIERRNTLFEAIAHGDDEHRAWLKEAIDAHFAGNPVPGVRGQGTKEAQLTSLRDALEQTDAHIRLMQRDLLAYLPPDSTMTDSDLVNLLIERLDGPEQREVQAISSKALSGIRGE